MNALEDLLDLEEAQDEARVQRASSYLLRLHPDCRDPDHPGCEKCMPDEGEETMKDPVRIVMEVRGGCLQAVYGDRLPEDVQVEFILRDFDNINAGDPDPMGEDYEPEVHYW